MAKVRTFAVLVFAHSFRNEIWRVLERAVSLVCVASTLARENLVHRLLYTQFHLCLYAVQIAQMGTSQGHQK